MTGEATLTTRSRHWQDSTCISCGYALRGLDEPRCPECGRSFDRDNPATFNSGRQCGPVARWLLKPTRWVGWFSGVVASAVVVVQMLLFLPVDLTLFIMALAWLALAGPYVFWSVIRRVVCRWYSQPTEFLRKDQRVRQKISRIVLIAGLVVYSQVPILISFRISKPALDRYANHLYTEVPIVTPPANMNRWCGLYYVSGCHLSGNGVEMFVGTRYMQYSPIDADHPHFWHFSGDWYSYGPQDHSPSLYPFLY
jgi:hypothetical protein